MAQSAQVQSVEVESVQVESVPVDIVPVESKRDLGRFIDLPDRLHRGKPGWVAPLRIGEWERFDPKRHPFHQHARVRPLLALQDGQVVGRIAHIDDDLHLATHEDGVGFFGFLEATSAGVAKALLSEVERRAAALGRKALRGPVNPSLNDSAGLQINAFERPPYVMMPWNPPQYPAWVEAAGFEKAKDLLAYDFDVTQGPSPALSRLAERVRKRSQPLVRAADPKNLDAELQRLKDIYAEAWERNWGFVRYTEEEFSFLAKELRMILDLEMVLFVELDGKVVGVAVCIPDANQVFARMPGGRLLPFGIVPLLRRKAIIDQVRMAIMGVLPAYRNRGLELVLIDAIARRGQERGYRKGECSWVLEDNHATIRGIEAAGGSLGVTYRVYQKEL